MLHLDATGQSASGASRLTFVGWFLHPGWVSRADESNASPRPIGAHLQNLLQPLLAHMEVAIGSSL